MPSEPAPVPDFKSISGYAGFPLQSGHSNSWPTTFTRPTHVACNAHGTTWVVDEDTNDPSLGYLRLIFDTRGTTSPHVQSVTSLAGVGVAPWTIGGIAIDDSGLELVVSDTWSHVIYKLPVGQAFGQPLAVVAGGPTNVGPFVPYGFVDGPANVAKFNSPSGVARDASGNLYVADTGNHAVRRISTSGVVTTVATDTKMVPSFDPKSIAVAPDGTVYVTSSQAVYRVTAGAISVLAGHPGVSGFGNGTPATSYLRDPKGLAVDRMGDVYVADSGNHVVRKILAASSTTTTIPSLPSFDPKAGFFDGYGPDETILDVPSDLAFWGDRLVFSDEGRLTIRTMNPAAPN